MSHSQEKQNTTRQSSSGNERSRKIEELKKAVANGSYRIKTRDLACDLLETLVDS